MILLCVVILRQVSTIVLYSVLLVFSVRELTTDRAPPVYTTVMRNSYRDPDESPLNVYCRTPLAGLRVQQIVNNNSNVIQCTCPIVIMTEYNLAILRVWRYIMVIWTDSQFVMINASIGCSGPRHPDRISSDVTISNVETGTISI